MSAEIIDVRWIFDIMFSPFTSTEARIFEDQIAEVIRAKGEARRVVVKSAGFHSSRTNYIEFTITAHDEAEAEAVFHSTFDEFLRKHSHLPTVDVLPSGPEAPPVLGASTVRI